jgi:hypothetical protein
VTLAVPGDERWSPVVGPEAELVLDTIGVSDRADRSNLLEDALEILRRCVPPTSPLGTSTGLAVGQIQSGKTSSFTTVAALARDNRYAAIIVIAGTNLPLFRQSNARLRHDLRLLDRKDRAWLAIENPGPQDEARIHGPIDDWREGDYSQTVLLMVMKNHGRLRGLSELLYTLRLRDVPVLIIDDEADQASLNNLAQRTRQSTTYRMLLEMRSHLSVYTFLQYTATPQAPLLISLIDSLSPEFARVLRPGKSYTGGRTFFIDKPDLVRVIPQADLPVAGNDLVAPPESLLRALRLFFIGVAVEYVRSGGAQPSGNRSMLIHPSMGILPHEQFGLWVREIRRLWCECLEADTSEPEYAEVFEDFLIAYEDVSQTVADLPPFADVMSRMRKAMDRTLVTVMNAAQIGGTPNLNWNDRYAHILVGGEVLNRGFTVEGLTVTYMPRSVGVGNVDTVQQRARFFGYKSRYIGYCRVFLEAAVKGLFRLYIDHEESLQAELLRHGDAPLSQWKRAFLLDKQYSPTRRSVLGLDIFQGDFAAKWFRPAAPHRNESAVAENYATVSSFCQSIANWHRDPGSPQRTPEQIHLMAEWSADKVLEGLLAPLRLVDGNDSVEFTGLLLQLRTYLEEHSALPATVYRMSGRGTRRRGLNSGDELINLFQGRNPLRGPVTYPGDDKIRRDGQLSVQIHLLRVDTTSSVVPAVAVWLPQAMSRGFLVARGR